MIQKWFEPFTLMEPDLESTRLGSDEGSFTEGMTFSGVVSFHTGSEVSAAGQMVLEETPVLLHEFDVTLSPNDYVRRDRDGAIFRVASRTDSMRTPEFSGLRFCQVRVERVVLPC